MGKRQAKKQPKKTPQQPLNEQDEIQQLSGQSKKNREGSKGRHDNSLAFLTKKFIDLIKSSKDMTLDLNEAVIVLKVQKRRIYDITNVLEGIQYVQKTHKNTIKWIANNENSVYQQQIIQMKAKIQEMIEQQNRLNANIEQMNNRIKQEFLDNQEMRQYHFVTHEDLLKMQQTINQQSQTQKTMLIISAPRGTILELGKGDKEENIFRMDSTGKGKVTVYSCSSNTVAEVDFSKQI